MFRMTPQDPEVNGGQPSAVPTPRLDPGLAHQMAQTTQRLEQHPDAAGQITQRMEVVTQRMEPVTQFFSRDDLLSGLSQQLPDVINHLTPDGRLPTDSELSGRL